MFLLDVAKMLNVHAKKTMVKLVNIDRRGFDSPSFALQSTIIYVHYQSYCPLCLGGNSAAGFKRSGLGLGILGAGGAEGRPVPNLGSTWQPDPVDLGS